MFKYKLNKSQKEAVEYLDGHLLIIAGAGTGKTAVITQKICHLINTGLAKPEEILALTFTDKAANEMQERVDELLFAAPETSLKQTGYLDMQISTFHSFCQKILENYGLQIGLGNQFKLLTQTDSWLLIRQNLDKFNLDYYRPLGNPTRHIHELIKHFSKCKDELISPKDYLDYAEDQILDKDKIKQVEITRLTEIANAYHLYNQLLLDNNCLDFGDLIFYTIKLLKERPQILKLLQSNYKYILVDEFQDVNWAQYQLIKLLIDSNNQLTVVGDDDQSIYAFRGASVSNILGFKDDFPEAKEIVLTENYRSSQEILDLAYKAIQNNNPDRLEVKLQVDKKLIARNLEKQIPNSVEYTDCVSIDDEVAWVIKKIRKISEDKSLVLSDIAILVRANSQAEPFIHGLEQAGIPYDFLASAGLFHQPIILDCFNFFKVIDNYHESSAIYRLLCLPIWKLAENDLQKIIYLAKKKSISYYEGLKRVTEWDISKEGIAICNKIISLIYEGMKQTRDNKPTVILYNFLENSGYLKYLTHEEEQENGEVLKQIHYLKQFLDYLNAYEQKIPGVYLAQFLEYYNYIIESGDEGGLKRFTSNLNAVNILTVHASKGLEFKNVFVVNLAEEKFPTRRHGEGIEIPLSLIKEHLPEGDYHYEEERRLFYVAVTRAKEKLFLTSAEDYGGKRKAKISRFLTELGFEIKFDRINMEKVKTENLKLGNEINQPLISQHQEFPISTSFSYSQISSFERCPYQYKLAYILHLPTRGNASFSFGQTMHSTLQQFYQRIQELNSIKQNTLFGLPKDNSVNSNIKVPTLDELLKIYGHNWQEDWYLNKKQREDYYQKGKEILKNYYTVQADNWTSPVVLEGGFKIKLGNYTLNGRIDRVDKLADGSLEILDYKTGQAKEKIVGDDKDQLLIYQLAASSLPEYRNIGQVNKLTFCYLNDNKFLSFLGKPEELEKLQNKLLGAIAEIRKGNFVATPEKHTCAHCDFRDICEFRKL